MTKFQIEVALAKLMGWKECSSTFTHGIMIPPDGIRVKSVPSVTLDWVNKIEKEHCQSWEYLFNLKTVVGVGYYIREDNWRDQLKVTLANEWLRAEAILKTVGKWRYGNEKEIEQEKQQTNSFC